MDTLESDGFLVAGGPLGDEDRAHRVLHIVEAQDESMVMTRLNEDPWTQSDMLTTLSIEPWTVLLGGIGTR